jgi:hypothetical protein
MSQTASKWRIGANAGINSSNIFNRADFYVASGSSLDSQSSWGFSPSGGFLVAYKLNDRIAFQGEANYLLVKSGQSHTTPLPYSTSPLTQPVSLTNKFQFAIHYLDIPLIVDYSIINRKKLAFMIGVGCSFKYAMKSEVVNKRIGEIQVVGPNVIIRYSPVTSQMDLTGETNFILMSPVVQTSLELKKQNFQSFRFVLRYSLSTEDPFQEPPMEARSSDYRFIDWGVMRLQTLSLSVQYRMGVNDL